MLAVMTPKVRQHSSKFGDILSVLQVPSQPILQRIQERETIALVKQGWVTNGIKCFGEVQSNEVNVGVSLEEICKNMIEVDEGTCCWASWPEGKLIAKSGVQKLDDQRWDRKIFEAPASPALGIGWESLI